MDIDRSVFELIHTELDANPSDTWTEDEAWLVAMVLVGIRNARNGTSRPLCTRPQRRTK